MVEASLASTGVIGVAIFNGARFSGGTVTFDTAKFVGGAVTFNFAEFSGGTVTRSAEEFRGWPEPLEFRCENIILC